MDASGRGFMPFAAQMRYAARSVRVLPLAASGLAAGVLASGGAAAAAPAPASGGCAAVEVLAARGTGEPQSGSVIMGGLVNAIAQRTSGQVYQVRYPASTDYVNGPNEGASDAL